jgi:hypothetical protein
MSNAIYENQNSFHYSKNVICKEEIMMVPVVIYTQKDFYLNDALNEKVEDYKSAGLIDFWHFQFIDKKFIEIKETKAPKVLTLEQLVGSFYILLIGCFVSFTVFMLEMSSKLMKKYL